MKDERRVIKYALEIYRTELLKDLFKYHKQRIDWKNYKLPINDEIVEEMTEEVIEQLI